MKVTCNLMEGEGNLNLIFLKILSLDFRSNKSESTSYFSFFPTITSSNECQINTHLRLFQDNLIQNLNRRKQEQEEILMVIFANKSLKVENKMNFQIKIPCFKDSKTLNFGPHIFAMNMKKNRKSFNIYPLTSYELTFEP
jgi:hypothetical protein